MVDAVYELFLDLDATDDQVEFPIVYTNAREGWASLDEGAEGTDLSPLLDLMVDRIPAPEYDPDHPLQAHVTNLDASPYVGRLALCRVRNGTIRSGAPIAWCRSNGTVERATVTDLYVTDALERVEATEAGPGEIIAVAGLPEVTIGDTLADPDDPRPLPVITVDEPSLSIVVGINTSPLAGRDGSKLTARQVRARLDQELVGNVSIRVADTERPDAWEVHGRGELQLVVLLEMMRREGFELTAGQPQVITREIDGVMHEPVERMAIDAPEEYVGVITQMLALRKGRMEQMVNHSTGWVRLDYLVPARSLIGFRTEFLTETRGTGLLHHVFDRWEPWAGAHADPPHRLARVRSRRRERQLRAVRTPGARHAVRRAGRGRLRGHDRRRERALRGPGRESRQAEAADQRARRQRRHPRPPRARAAAGPRPGARVPARGRGRGDHARERAGCARPCWTRPTGARPRAGPSRRPTDRSRRLLGVDDYPPPALVVEPGPRPVEHGLGPILAG